jgi:hypothetical protein
MIFCCGSFAVREHLMKQAHGGTASDVGTPKQPASEYLMVCWLACAHFHMLLGEKLQWFSNPFMA